MGLYVLDEVADEHFAVLVVSSNSHLNNGAIWSLKDHMQPSIRTFLLGDKLFIGRKKEIPDFCDVRGDVKSAKEYNVIYRPFSIRLPSIRFRTLHTGLNERIDLFGVDASRGICQGDV